MSFCHTWFYKSNKILIRESIEALIKAENLSSLYEAALTYVGAALQDVQLFKDKNPNQQCQQYIRRIAVALAGVCLVQLVDDEYKVRLTRL